MRLRELLDELTLLVRELGRRHDLHADPQVAAPGTAQLRHAAVLDHEDVGALHAGPDLELDGAVEAVDRGVGAEDRVGHLDLERREQVVALAAVDVVVPHLHLEVQVTRRAAGGTDLALARHLQAQTGLDARGHVDRDRPARTDAALPLARRARAGDDGAVAAAGAAGGARHDVAEQRADLALDVAGAAADVARARARAGRAARAVAGLAQHGRVDLDVLVGAEDDLVEVDLDPEQGVLSALGAAPRAVPPAAATAAAEEGVEDVAEPAGRAAAEGAVGLRAGVVAPPLLGVAQHVVRVRHVLEALGGVRARVDVRVQLARQPSVGLLDVGIGGVRLDAEDVVVVCHGSLSRFRFGRWDAARAAVRSGGAERVRRAPCVGLGDRSMFAQQLGQVPCDRADRGHVGAVVHAGRAEDAQTGDRSPAGEVPAGDDAGGVEAVLGVLGADAGGHRDVVDLHLAEQPEQGHLFLDRLEHGEQAAGEVPLALGEVRGARHHQAVLPVRGDLLDERRDDHSTEGLRVGTQLPRDLAEGPGDVLQEQADRGAVHDGAEFGEGGLVERDVGLHDPLLDPGGVRDEDDHEPGVAQAHELDVLHAGPHHRRVLHEGDLVRELAEEPDRAAEDLVEVVGGAEERLDRVPLRARERAGGGQVVDEDPVALVGRDPPGRGVRGDDELLVLELGHVVADRGGADAEGVAVDDRLRTDRFARRDVVPHDGLEDLEGAFADHPDPFRSMLALGRVDC
ncbi:hypothetical protein Cus16_0645 [Curtobacterium sp. ER1/6]|nr:hypothetical protein Cus16_0645 [Curtobacterium sp. ER1/6]